MAPSFLARLGDPVLGAALRTRTASEVLSLVTGANADGDALLLGEAEDAALARAMERNGRAPYSSTNEAFTPA